MVISTNPLRSKASTLSSMVRSAMHFLAYMGALVVSLNVRADELGMSEGDSRRGRCALDSRDCNGSNCHGPWFIPPVAAVC